MYISFTRMERNLNLTIQVGQADFSACPVWMHTQSIKHHKHNKWL